ncbi:MAG: MgtC/SapB family protein [Dehalococcoidia bacterium]|nr:MgtC/SapB family protein [Dehalococcoidia bacterium]
MNIEIELSLRMLLAAALGAAIGYQRTWAKKPAGFRTHAVVALGVATFTVISTHGFVGGSIDPSRVAAGVVTGIGFIGGGTILRMRTHGGDTVVGITTAATIWTVAAIGMAAAVGEYIIATTATVLCLVILFMHPREN